MGIQGLWAPGEKHGDVFRHANLEAFREKRFAVDVSIYMHKFGHETPSIPPIERLLNPGRLSCARRVSRWSTFLTGAHPAKRYEHERRKTQSAKLEADSVKRADFVTALDAERAKSIRRRRRLMSAVSSKPEKLTVAGFGEIEVQMDVKADLLVRERHAREKERGGDGQLSDNHHRLMSAFDEAGIGYYIAGGDAEQLGAQLLI